MYYLTKCFMYYKYMYFVFERFSTASASVSVHTAACCMIGAYLLYSLLLLLLCSFLFPHVFFNSISFSFLSFSLSSSIIYLFFFFLSSSSSLMFPHTLHPLSPSHMGVWGAILIECHTDTGEGRGGRG